MFDGLASPQVGAAFVDVVDAGVVAAITVAARDQNAMALTGAPGKFGPVVEVVLPAAKAEASVNILDLETGRALLQPPIPADRHAQTLDFPGNPLFLGDRLIERLRYPSFRIRPIRWQAPGEIAVPERQHRREQHLRASL